MDNKKFNLWNRIAAAAVFVVSAFTYLSTIEPTASYWDCGEFIASSYFDYTKDAAYGNVYYEAFVALSDVGTLDVITMEADSIAALGQSGRLIDLQSEPCADIAKKYEDRLIYYYPPDDAEDDSPVAVGIDVSDSRLVTEYGLYQDSCGIAVGAHSQNIAAVEAFLDFILEDD
jgi:hypothetical protein